MAKTRVVRLQVELEAAQMEELEKLADLGGLRTKKDLLNNALTLLKWAARQKAEGSVIQSVNRSEGTVKELEMPFLETLAALARDSRDSDVNDRARRGKDSARLVGAKR